MKGCNPKYSVIYQVKWLIRDFGELMGLLDKPLQVKRKRRKRVEHQCAYGEQEKELVERWKICLEERIWSVPRKMRDKGQ